MDGISSWWDFVQDRSDQIRELTLEHLSLVLQVIVVATLISISLGVAVRNHPTAKAIALGVAGIFLTIPSLALFTIFIPIVGLGFAPSFIALTMYAILPILRNTVTGLDEVDPAVIESAKGVASGHVPGELSAARDPSRGGHTISGPEVSWHAVDAPTDARAEPNSKAGTAFDPIPFDGSMSEL